MQFVGRKSLCSSPSVWNIVVIFVIIYPSKMKPVKGFDKFWTYFLSPGLGSTTLLCQSTLWRPARSKSSVRPRCRSNRNSLTQVILGSKKWPSQISPRSICLTWDGFLVPIGLGGDWAKKSNGIRYLSRQPLANDLSGPEGGGNQGGQLQGDHWGGHDPRSWKTWRKGRAVKWGMATCWIVRFGPNMIYNRHSLTMILPVTKLILKSKVCVQRPHWHLCNIGCRM